MSETLRPLEYAVSTSGARWRPAAITVWMFAVTCALTLMSLYHFAQYAQHEPFMTGMSKEGAIFYIGGGTVLIVLWVSWIAASVLMIARGRLHWSWVVLMPWALLNVCFVHVAIDGYMQDALNY